MCGQPTAVPGHIKLLSTPGRLPPRPVLAGLQWAPGEFETGTKQQRVKTFGATQVGGDGPSGTAPWALGSIAQFRFPRIHSF